MIRRTQGEGSVGREASVPRRPGGGDRRHRIQLFTVAETAEMLRVATRTVRRWITSGDLVAHRLGGVVRIAESDLQAFLALRRRG
jgi:excisionase family DNA binding protein